MGESFQDFKADFPISKMLNSANYNSFSDLFTDNLNTNHLNLKLLGRGRGVTGILQVLSYEFLKFRILEIINFHPCTKCKM